MYGQYYLSSAVSTSPLSSCIVIAEKDVKPLINSIKIYSKNVIFTHPSLHGPFKWSLVILATPKNHSQKVKFRPWRESWKTNANIPFVRRLFNADQYTCRLTVSIEFSDKQEGYTFQNGRRTRKPTTIYIKLNIYVKAHHLKSIVYRKHQYIWTFYYEPPTP